MHHARARSMCSGPPPPPDLPEGLAEHDAGRLVADARQRL